MMLDGEFKNHEKWDRAKKSECLPRGEMWSRMRSSKSLLRAAVMSDVGGFLQALERYDARVMSEDLIARLEPYIKADVRRG